MRIEDAKISLQQGGNNTIRTFFAQKPAAIMYVDTLATELLGTATADAERTLRQRETQRLNGVYRGYVDGEQRSGRFKGNVDTSELTRFDRFDV
jgi:hypothetical protein